MQEQNYKMCNCRQMCQTLFRYNLIKATRKEQFNAIHPWVPLKIAMRISLSLTVELRRKEPTTLQKLNHPCSKSRRRIGSSVQWKADDRPAKSFRKMKKKPNIDTDGSV